MDNHTVRSKERIEVINSFKSNHKHLRLDLESDRELLKIGVVFQDGYVNELFKEYYLGFALGKSQYQLNETAQTFNNDEAN